MAVPSTTRSSPHAHSSLRVSRYDQVSGFLVTTLLVFGAVTLLMFFIWLSHRLMIVNRAVPVTVLEDVGGGGSGTMLGGQQQLEEPSPEDVREVAEQSVAQTLESISSVVGAKAQDLDALQGGGGTSLGKGDGTGTGDGRGKGPGGPGTSDGVPAHERWEIRMSATSLDEYARQLDFFKVELGVVGGGSPDVEYISDLSAAKPKVRVGSPAQETRIRFLHRSGELRQADRQLAAKAGVRTDGRIVFQFYDDDTYRILLALEATRKGRRRLAEVRRTVFGVQPRGSDYEFYVIDQQYLGSS